MKPTLCFVLIISSWLLGSCGRAPRSTQNHSAPAIDQVLVSVQGHPIYLADFEAELGRRSRGDADIFSRPKAKEDLVEELLTFESVYLRAREAGFDQKPEIARLIKRLIVDRYTQEHLATAPAPATEAEIADYYEQHALRYARSARARFAVIQFGFSPRATAEKKAEVFRKATLVLEEARALPASEPAFGALAQQYSENQATRYISGDAGWHSRGEPSRWDGAVTDAVFALEKTGDLSPVITTADGCYVVKLIERKDAARRGLAEVREAIAYQLAIEKQQRARQEFYDGIKAGLKIEINRPLLQSLGAPSIQTETKPPPPPAG